MTRPILITLLVIVASCSNYKSKHENNLAKVMGTFIIAGQYDVQVIVIDSSNKKTTREGQVTLTNKSGLIEFKGNISFDDMDSLGINYNNSTVFRNFLMVPIIDTFSMTAEDSGIDIEYSGYAFGDVNSNGIEYLPEFKKIFTEKMRSENKSLFLVGYSKKNKAIVIKQMEKIIESGSIIQDVNKTFILTRDDYRQL